MHENHRQRLKRRFLSEGLDSFEHHNMLELLLFYSIPRVDTNPIAHRLLQTFGTLDGVLEAPIEELERVKGIGSNSATLIKLVCALFRQYGIAKEAVGLVLLTTEQVGKYVLPYYIGEVSECVRMICLDSKGKVILSTELFRGNVNSAQVSIRMIVSLALRCEAAGVIIAHNHPGGTAIPSTEDVTTTQLIKNALDTVGVALLDHLVVADGDFVSMADSGFFAKMR
jgi:DNA repair protein RadC